MGQRANICWGISTSSIRKEHHEGAYQAGDPGDQDGCHPHPGGKENTRILKCNDHGDCTAFGSPGMALGEFNGIADVEVNNSDNIVVVDKFNNRM